LSPEARVAVRRKDIAPLVNDLIEWMKRERGKLSRHNEVAKAFDYMLKRIDVFTRFLDDGRICLSNNAAERELRGIAMLESLCIPVTGAKVVVVRAVGLWRGSGWEAAGRRHLER
jgi:Transposase IS66 family